MSKYLSRYVNYILILLYVFLYKSNNYIISYHLTNKSINNKDIYFSIYIPKINLYKDIYHYKNINNDVNKGIMLVNDYSFDNLSGSMILASHSGNSHISYFKNLYKLKINDKVYIYFNNYKYEFLIKERYFINKNGKFTYNDFDKGIYLITCDKKNKTKQIVYTGKLKEYKKVRFFEKNRTFLNKKKEIRHVVDIYISVEGKYNGIY